MMDGAREREARLVGSRVGDGRPGAADPGAAVRRDRECRPRDSLRLVEVLRPGDRDRGAVRSDGRTAHGRRGGVAVLRRAPSDGLTSVGVDGSAFAALLVIEAFASVAVTAAFPAASRTIGSLPGLV